MLDTLLWAVENLADGVRILDVPKIRELSGRWRDQGGALSKPPF
jgi:hypothetical protein